MWATLNPIDRHKETIMPHSSLKLTGLLLSLLLSCATFATEPVALNPTHPDRYTVVKGDTLWDIAGTFLRNPWQWPEVWHVNPQIENPHLIYPGDIITLTYLNGKPRLSIQRGNALGSTVKLSPQIRSTPLDTAIPIIPMGDILPFLSRPYVMDKEDLDAAPYIVSFREERIAGTTHDKIYVRSIESEEHSRYDIVRPGKPYKDADTGEILGYEAMYIGTAELERTGDPASLTLLNSKVEAIAGHRLLPVVYDKRQKDFYPKSPDIPIKTTIIAVFNGVSQIGQHNIVVLDRGADDGLAPGHVLTVDKRGATIFDRISPDPHDKVTLPDERAGVLMVFRTFPRVSFGIIMSATTVIHVLDRAHTP